jgi:hypothetical protein
MSSQVPDTGVELRRVGVDDGGRSGKPQVRNASHPGKAGSLSRNAVRILQSRNGHADEQVIFFVTTNGLSFKLEMV